MNCVVIMFCYDASTAKQTRLKSSGRSIVCDMYALVLWLHQEYEIETYTANADRVAHVTNKPSNVRVIFMVPM